MLAVFLTVRQLTDSQVFHQKTSLLHLELCFWVLPPTASLPTQKQPTYLLCCLSSSSPSSSHILWGQQAAVSKPTLNSCYRQPYTPDTSSLLFRSYWADLFVPLKFPVNTETQTSLSSLQLRYSSVTLTCQQKHLRPHSHIVDRRRSLLVSFRFG